MKIIKHCIVCGSEFVARQDNYTMCSDACRKQRKQKMREVYRKQGKRKDYRYKRVDYKCRICGGSTGKTQHYHDICILEQAYADYRAGKGQKESPAIVRAKNFGFTASDIREYGDTMEVKQC